MKVKPLVSLGPVLFCVVGAVAVAQAQSVPGDKASPTRGDDPVPDPDPDDPGPAPDDPEPLPDKVAVPERGSVKVQSYVEQLPKPPDASDIPKQASESATICLNAHVQNSGWQGWRCQPSGSVVSVGTTGQSLRMEALAMVSYGAGGGCAIAHVQGIGWQGWACGANGQIIAVGTTGKSLRMEAVGIGTYGAALSARAHVASLGWLGWTYAAPGYAAFVGTTGQNRRMEALDVVLY